MAQHRILQRMAWHVGPVMAALLAFLIAKEIDTRLFPVVTDFSLTRLQPDAGGVTIQGTLHKRRDCRFVEVVAYGDESRPVQLTFLDRPAGAQPTTRAVRVQLWGPWHVASDGARIVTLVARHECHALWDHSTILTSFAVREAP